MSDTAVNLDLSGTPVPVIAEVPSPDPVSAPAPPALPAAPITETTTPAPPQTQVAVPAATAPPIVAVPQPTQPTLSKELAEAVDGLVHDLSGAEASAASLLRFVPRLAAVVHTLQIRGVEKRDLVMAAAHVLVSRVVPEADRPAAHEMVDAAFPPAIAAVIDVVAGRVTFQQAVVAASHSEATTAVVASTGNCLTQMLSACLRKN